MQWDSVESTTATILFYVFWLKRDSFECDYQPDIYTPLFLEIQYDH